MLILDNNTKLSGVSAPNGRQINRRTDNCMEIPRTSSNHVVQPKETKSDIELAGLAQIHLAKYSGQSWHTK